MICTVMRNEENITVDKNVCTSISLNEPSDQFLHNINDIIIFFSIDKVNR